MSEDCHSSDNDIKLPRPSGDELVQEATRRLQAMRPEDYRYRKTPEGIVLDLPPIEPERKPDCTLVWLALSFIAIAFGLTALMFGLIELFLE